MNKKLLLLLVVILVKFNSVHAQGTAGKEFWVAFMAQDWGCYYNYNYWNNDTAELFLSSQYPAKVVVTAAGQGFSDSVILEPNVTRMLRLPREVVCRYSDSVTTNGVHIKSDTTINVYAVNRYWYSKGATVVLPITSIVVSPEYFITTNADFYSWGWTCNGKQIQSPEFTIVGIADSSVIEIVPTGASSRYSVANVPFQITLKKGETFQYITTDRDLTGSVVRSKYPFSKYSVFAGNRQTYTDRTINGVTCYSSWDHDYEQMMPTVNWGNEYTAIPYKNNKNGYNLKIVAAENNTFIYINSNYVQKLNQGEFLMHYVLSDTLTRITSNNRISVAQFQLGGYNCNNHPTKPYIGDPSQVQLFPDEQFGTNATVNTVSQVPWWWWNNNWWWLNNTPEHYINVMTKTVDTGYFTWNNAKVKDTAWKTAGNFNGYSYAQIQIDTGSHYIQSDKGFLAYVYGYGYFEGYAYAAAANFRPIQNNFLIVNAQCVKDTISFVAIENDSFSNYYWTFGDNTTATGPKVKHKYADTGWYDVKMYCNHIITNALDSVTKSLYVADTKIKKLFDSDTAICGPVEMVLISKGFNIDNEYRWNDGHPVYYRAVKNPGIYWLDVQERNGCIFRDSFVVTNSTIPRANFDVSEDVFCLNNNRDIVFKNHSTFQDSIKHYIWDFGDTIVKTFDTNTSVIHKFKKANIYPIILRAETKYGCYHDTFMIVEVMPSPIADFGFLKKDTCIKANGILLQNNSKSDINEIRRYKWAFSEGYNVSNNNPGPRSYTNTGDYNIKLMYEYKNGCVDTMIQYVQIVGNPVADFTKPNYIYCTRDSIPFDASASTSTSFPLKYLWSFDDGSKDSFLIAKKAFSTTDTNYVKLLITSPEGCKDSVVKKIFVNEKPLVDFVINKDTQCFVGHNYNFTNTTVFKGGSLNYAWELSNGFNSTDSNLVNIRFLKDSIYKVKLSTTTAAGCNAGIEKSIYLGAYPIADFTIANDKQCLLGNVFNLTNQSNIKKGSVSNTIWNLGNTDTSHAKDVLGYTYLADGTYDVQLISISNLGCMDTLKKSLTVFPQPVSKFSVNDSDQCVNNQKFILTNQSTLKSGNMSFQWNFGNNTNSNDTIGKITYGANGNYTIGLITKSAENCADTSYKLVTIQVNPKSAFDVDNDRQCFKDNLFNLSNKSNISQGNILSQTWLMGDGSSFTSQDVANYSYQTEDSFAVKLITLSDKNCLDTLSKLLITHAQPMVKFVIPNDTQCWQKNKFAIQNETKLKYGVLNNTWDFGDGTQSNQYSPNAKVYPNTSASYLIKYKAVTAFGCSDSAQHNIALLERPISAFDVNDTIQCFNAHSFDFINKTNFSVMNTLSYWWDYKNGTTSTDFLPLNASYVGPGVYDVQLVSYSSLTNCFDTSYRRIVAAPQTQVDFDINNDIQCFRYNEFQFDNKSQIDFGDMNFKWSFGDNTSSSDTSPLKSYATEKTHLVKLVSTSNYGCIDSIEKNINFFASPKASFTINDTAQCLNMQSFDFRNSTTLANGTFDSKWLMDDLSTYTTNDVLNKQFAQHDIHTVQLSVITDNACVDTISRQVYLENIKNFDLLLNENDSQCLKGNLFDFSSQSHNPKVTLISSEWLYGDGQSSIEKDPNPIRYLRDSLYEVSYISLSANGCRDTNKMKVTVHPHPKSAFNVSAVCFPEPSLFNNASTIKSGTINQNIWTIDHSVASNQTHPLHKFNAPGEYDVQLITFSNYGCADTLMIDKVALVKSTPNASFDFEIMPLTSADETQLQYRNLTTDASSYQWDFGNYTYSILDNPIGTYKDTGRYWVTLVATSDAGCTDTFRLNTGSLIPDFIYYLPNAFSPNGDIHNNVYKGAGSLYAFKFKMEIYNRWGEKLWETTDIHEGWDGYSQGELCQQGNYMCRVQLIPFKGSIKVYEQMFILLR